MFPGSVFPSQRKEVNREPNPVPRELRFSGPIFKHNNKKEKMKNINEQKIFKLQYR
jgi:hypothetical protein